MRALRFVLIGALALGASSCKDALVVTNPNQPDGNRALARPSDVEALVGSAYQIVHSATLGAFCAIQTQALTMSLESYSNLANNNMGPRAAIPRSPVDNSRGNAVAGSNYRDWALLHRAARQASVALSKLNNPSFTFFPVSQPQVYRDRGVAWFVLGTALGNLALIYDQAAPISPTDNTVTNPADPTPLALVPFDSIMRLALADLDSSMHYDSLAGSSWPCSTCTTWFGSPSRFTGGTATTIRDSLVAWTRGYKARFRAGVARDPTARAAVDWTKVIADATAFLATYPTGDFTLNMNPSAAWDIGWMPTIFQSDQQSWSMMWMFIVGMADTSGGYANWIATPNTNKLPFLVVTPDKRFPSGTTRAAQQAAGQGQYPGSPMAAGVYIRNRSGSDWNGDPYANSWYDHERWANFVRNLSRIAPFPIMTSAEIRMLRAEGYIRQGNFAAASADIDVTRVANGGLPSIVAMNITSATQQIGPSATACVPKVPSLGASGTGTVACGTIMEAMKWEKRLETQWTAPYGWFIDDRGWGDLPQNTATEWPTPYQEIDTRILFPNAPPYVLGYGGGLANSSGPNTYGLH